MDERYCSRDRFHRYRLSDGHSRYPGQVSNRTDLTTISGSAFYPWNHQHRVEHTTVLPKSHLYRPKFATTEHCAIDLNADELRRKQSIEFTCWSKDGHVGSAWKPFEAKPIGEIECLQLTKAELRTVNLLQQSVCCSYDIFGEDYFPQPYMQCITCWGEESCYGVCIHCANHHHRGHELKRSRISKHFVCDCGRMKHRLHLCTAASTGTKRCQQPMYSCDSCFDTEQYRALNKGATPGVCLNCAKRCHRDHKIRFEGVSDAFFCDCGRGSFENPCNRSVTCFAKD